MAFGNMRGLGAWGVAFAASVALHVVVIGVMAVLGMRGCSSSDGDIPPLPPVPQTDGRAQDLPTRTDGEPEAATPGDSVATSSDVKADTSSSAKGKSKESKTRKTEKSERTKSEPSKSEPSKDGWRTYKVKAGDSLTKIARACGSTVQELAKANGLSPTASLQLGQTLKVKSTSADAE